VHSQPGVARGMGPAAGDLTVPSRPIPKKPLTTVKQAKQRFDSKELEVLRTAFRDLAARSNSTHAINKATFLKLMSNAPGILGDRLFEVFDTKQDGEIDFDEFVFGIAHYARGNNEDKIAFAFKIFDLSGQNQLTRAELETVLISIVLAYEANLTRHMTRTQAEAAGIVDIIASVIPVEPQFLEPYRAYLEPPTHSHASSSATTSSNSHVEDGSALGSASTAPASVSSGVSTTSIPQADNLALTNPAAAPGGSPTPSPGATGRRLQSIDNGSSVVSDQVSHALTDNSTGALSVSAAQAGVSAAGTVTSTSTPGASTRKVSSNQDERLLYHVRALADAALYEAQKLEAKSKQGGASDKGNLLPGQTASIRLSTSQLIPYEAFAKWLIRYPGVLSFIDLAFTTAANAGETMGNAAVTAAAASAAARARESSSVKSQKPGVGTSQANPSIGAADSSMVFPEPSTSGAAPTPYFLAHAPLPPPVPAFSQRAPPPLPHPHHPHRPSYHLHYASMLHPQPPHPLYDHSLYAPSQYEPSRSTSSASKGQPSTSKQSQPPPAPLHPQPMTMPSPFGLAAGPGADSATTPNHRRPPPPPPPHPPLVAQPRRRPPPPPPPLLMGATPTEKANQVPLTPTERSEQAANVDVPLIISVVPASPPLPAGPSGSVPENICGDKNSEASSDQATNCVPLSIEKPFRQPLVSTGNSVAALTITGRSTLVSKGQGDAALAGSSSANASSSDAVHSPHSATSSATSNPTQEEYMGRRGKGVPGMLGVFDARRELTSRRQQSRTVPRELLAAAAMKRDKLTEALDAVEVPNKSGKPSDFPESAEQQCLDTQPLRSPSIDELSVQQESFPSQQPSFTPQTEPHPRRSESTAPSPTTSQATSFLNPNTVISTEVDLRSESTNGVRIGATPKPQEHKLDAMQHGVQPQYFWNPYVAYSYYGPSYYSHPAAAYNGQYYQNYYPELSGSAPYATHLRQVQSPTYSHGVPSSGAPYSGQQGVSRSKSFLSNFSWSKPKPVQAQGSYVLSSILAPTAWQIVAADADGGEGELKGREESLESTDIQDDKLVAASVSSTTRTDLGGKSIIDNPKLPPPTVVYSSHVPKLDPVARGRVPSPNATALDTASVLSSSAGQPIAGSPNFRLQTTESTRPSGVPTATRFTFKPNRQHATLPTSYLRQMRQSRSHSNATEIPPIALTPSSSNVGTKELGAQPIPKMQSSESGTSVPKHPDVNQLSLDTSDKLKQGADETDSQILQPYEVAASEGTDHFNRDMAYDDAIEPMPLEYIDEDRDLGSSCSRQHTDVGTATAHAVVALATKSTGSKSQQPSIELDPRLSTDSRQEPYQVWLAPNLAYNPQAAEISADSSLPMWIPIAPPVCCNCGSLFAPRYCAECGSGLLIEFPPRPECNATLIDAAYPLIHCPRCDGPKDMSEAAEKTNSDFSDLPRGGNYGRRIRFCGWCGMDTRFSIPVSVGYAPVPQQSSASSSSSSRAINDSITQASAVVDRDAASVCASIGGGGSGNPSDSGLATAGATVGPDSSIGGWNQSGQASASHFRQHGISRGKIEALPSFGLHVDASQHALATSTFASDRSREVVSTTHPDWSRGGSLDTTKYLASRVVDHDHMLSNYADTDTRTKTVLKSRLPPQPELEQAPATSPMTASAHEKESSKQLITETNGPLPTMQGWLAKVGARFKILQERYFVLRDGFLYSYSKPGALTPRHVFFIEGCFIEPFDSRDKSELSYSGTVSESKPPEQEDSADIHEAEMHVRGKPRYGIEIIFQEHPRVAKTLYAPSASARDKWVTALLRHSKVQQITEKYTIGEEIGVGQFAKVHVARSHDDGRRYAVKVIDKGVVDSAWSEALRSEIAILKLVRHPYIIRLKEVFESRRQIYLVMQYAAGGDLFDYIRSRARLSESASQHIMFMILDAVRYLHARGVVHRDLKPENILVRGNAYGGKELSVSYDQSEYDRRSEIFSSDDTRISNVSDENPLGHDLDSEGNVDILISDFGLSKFASSDTRPLKTACGTLSYVAPEVLLRSGYGSKADVWSCGVIFYLMLAGKLPFEGSQSEVVMAKILRGSYSLDVDGWRDASPEARDLLSKLLTTNPDKRVTVEEALGHPWFSLDFTTRVRGASPYPRSPTQLQHSGAGDAAGDEHEPEYSTSHPNDIHGFHRRALSLTRSYSHSSPQPESEEQVHQERFISDDVSQRRICKKSNAHAGPGVDLDEDDLSEDSDQEEVDTIRGHEKHRYKQPELRNSEVLAAAAAVAAAMAIPDQPDDRKDSTVQSPTGSTTATLDDPQLAKFRTQSHNVERKVESIRDDHFAFYEVSGEANSLLPPALTMPPPVVWSGAQQAPASAQPVQAEQNSADLSPMPIPLNFATQNLPASIVIPNADQSSPTASPYTRTPVKPSHIHARQQQSSAPGTPVTPGGARLTATILNATGELRPISLHALRDQEDDDGDFPHEPIKFDL